LASPNPTIRKLSARNAALIRHGSENGSVATDLAAARLADYIKRVVDEAPALTPEQRDRLAVLLRGGAE